MKKSYLVTASLVATVSLLSGCGSSDAELDAANVQSITVAETAGMPSAFLEYGVQEGYFLEHGLDISVDTSAGGAAAVPALVSGDIDLAGSNIVTSLLAVGRGLPIKFVAPGTHATEDPDRDFSAVLVSSNSDISRPADLEGSRVAVNTLENIGDLTISEVIEADGGDPSLVEFVEIGFPDMLPVLERGEIEAAWLIEPFVTMGLDAGNESIMRPYVDAKPGLMVGTILATEQYINENSDVIEAFQAGIADTANAVQENEEAFRAALPDLAGISDEQAESITLAEWKDTIDIESMTFIEEAMQEQGILDEPLGDVQELIVD